MPDISLRSLQVLGAFKLIVGFDLGNQVDAHLTLWRKIESMIRSLSENVALRSLVLEGVFPPSLLNHGWARSRVREGLRPLLHSIGCRFALLVDSGRMSAVTIKPCYPAVSHAETEQKRIESLLEALGAYGMLRY